MHYHQWLLVLLCFPAALLANDELPRLSKTLDPNKLGYAEQKQLADLPHAYVSTAPENLDDGLAVGKLDLPGTREAVAKLVANDRSGKYQNLDSLLLWKDGKLVFEMYNRRGRVDAPHYTMSITKTLTSVTLARAIQLQLLKLQDLDRPIVELMPEIDRTRIQKGTEQITLNDALMMKSGLRFKQSDLPLILGRQYQRQAYFQKLLEGCEPVTLESRQYKYTGLDPSLVMMIIDIKTGGKVQEFIANEVSGKFGAIYNWSNQGCGIPKCGAGSSFSSRSLVKIGTALISGGKFAGEQILSAEYLRRVMDPGKGAGYFYFFHNRSKGVAKGKINFISGIGAGGQYLAMFPGLKLVMVATAHNQKAISLPLQAAMDHLLPLFQE
ncbi:MAG: serine hydrolase [Planctomycetota bacterium]|nr:serine hydrolase [Planctomycetota bacterium]